MGGYALILLDTHTLFWLDQSLGPLGTEAHDMIESAQRDGDLAVSAITFWEIAMLKGKDRLALAPDVVSWRTRLLQAGLIEIPLDGATAAQAVELKGLPRDPADRWIVATCLRRDATLLTADQRLLDWTGSLKSHDARL